jgi:hypothetical protein
MILLGYTKVNKIVLTLQLKETDRNMEEDTISFISVLFFVGYIIYNRYIHLLILFKFIELAILINIIITKL